MYNKILHNVMAQVEPHVVRYDQTPLFRSIVEAQGQDSLNPQSFKEKVAQQLMKRDLK